MTTTRRNFLRGVAAAGGAAIPMVLPPAIRRALAIGPHRRTGTLEDVEHIVVLMQENRSFDHYFGTLAGVRGFGDRFPIPLVSTSEVVNKTVWYQSNAHTDGSPSVVAPFRLDTENAFQYMRVTGTPHNWVNAQQAWADGRMNQWPRYKNDHSLGYFTSDDIPFQFAMAEAFTLCDAYHCSFQGGTNPNRLFMWTGNNDPLKLGNGPAINNDYDNLEHDPTGGYTWVTYTERLEAAGISWQVYENMADNFTDNPLAGFRSYRDAVSNLPGALAALRERGLSTRDLDKLKEDVERDQLPQVSFIVATAEGSEHPGPSSPAQGADYTALVLDALTANPKVWSKTVFIVNFDENDGFFDHVPPPAAPSYVLRSGERIPTQLAGASTVDTTGEYHEFLASDVDDVGRSLQHKPYGLGPRVPLYVLSPWSRGGWVNSQVFDHTSVIRLIEQRFGVEEPNISAWRRAVCGDLLSTLDFEGASHDDFLDELPDTSELAERARALPSTSTPPTPHAPVLPVQDYGVRPSRALPYELHVNARVDPSARNIGLTFASTGAAGAVFHVYDKRHLDRVPRRYTVEAGKHIEGVWELEENADAYDLWVLGPNGFHRHFVGSCALRTSPHVYRNPEIQVYYDQRRGDLWLKLKNHGRTQCTFELAANAYFYPGRVRVEVGPHSEREHYWSLRRSAHWYDFTATVREIHAYARRFAGRVETGRDSFSDPAMGGIALGEQS